MLAQPAALRARVAADLEPVREALALARAGSRVVLAGMGSSHHATAPLWRALVAAGVPAWRLDTAELLECRRDLAVPGTVLWLTSQSGESAETVRLLDEVGSDVPVVGVTNVEGSTLGRAAQVRLDLLAGAEATVSTKSYLNTVALCRLAAAELAGTTGHVAAGLLGTADALDVFLDELPRHVAAVGRFAEGRHLLLTGRGSAVPSAMAGALVLKEAAKVAAEGMSAATLRHGVIELAGPHLSVIFFDHGDAALRDQNVRLAADLVARGTEVAWVDGHGASHAVLPAPSGSGVDPSVRDAAAFQVLSFAFAARSGVTPGDFAVASKVTDVL